MQVYTEVTGRMPRLVERLGLTRFEADEYYKKALHAYEDRDLESARLAMEEAIRLLPTNSEYYAARGFFYLQDSITDRAAEDFEEALRHYQYEVLAHYGLGIIAYNHRDMKTAIEHFLTAYRADPKRAETIYYLALAYHHDGQNALALSFMQQALAAFEQKGDSKNKGHTAKWIKTLERLVQQEGESETHQPQIKQGSQRPLFTSGE